MVSQMLLLKIPFTAGRRDCQCSHPDLHFQVVDTIMSENWCRRCGQYHVSHSMSRTARNLQKWCCYLEEGEAKAEKETSWRCFSPSINPYLFPSLPGSEIQSFKQESPNKQSSQEGTKPRLGFGKSGRSLPHPGSRSVCSSPTSRPCTVPAECGSGIPTPPQRILWLHPWMSVVPAINTTVTKCHWHSSWWYLRSKRES